MKRILIFTPEYYPGHVSTREVSVKEITDRIRGDDIVFELVTLRASRSLPRVEQIGNVLVRRVGLTPAPGWSKEAVDVLAQANRFFFPFLSVWAIRPLAKKAPYDALWVLGLDTASVAALWYRRVIGRVPYLLSLEEYKEGNDLELTVVPPTPQGMVRELLLSARMVQSVSHQFAQWARNLGYRGAVEVVPNPTDIGQFGRGYPEHEIAELRVLLHKGEEDRFLITTSKLTSEHAISDVIRVLPKLPEVVKLLVLGAGADRASLAALAETTGVAARVQFLGEIERVEIPKYLHAADVFIRPALTPGMSNSLVEAMSVGIPVVATAMPGIEHFLADPELHPGVPPTGLAYAPGNLEDLARHILRFMTDPPLRNLCTTNARNAVQREYNWDFIVERMVNVVFRPLLAPEVEKVVQVEERHDVTPEVRL